MKALLTVCMILSLTRMPYAHADSLGTAGRPSAEEVLLAQLYQIEGQNLNADQGQAQIQSALQIYENVAQPEGRQERMAEALVNVGGFDPAIAQDLTQQIAASTTSVQVAQIVGQMPHGAQFSLCNPGLPGLSLFLVGAGFITVFSANNEEPQAGVGAGLFVLGAVSLLLESTHCSN